MRSAGLRLLAALVLLAGGDIRAAEAGSPRMLLLDAATVNSDIIAVGERGTVVRSSDAGRTWRSVAVPTRAALTGIGFPSEENTTHGWVVGHDALILGTADGGRTWRKQFQGENLEDSFLDVLALDPRHAIAVGAYALCVVTRDGGKTWTRQKIIEGDYHFNRITRGPTGTLYLAGEHGTLLRSMDTGVSWAPIPAPYTGSFYGVIPLGERTLLAHGLRGHVYRSNDDGASWETVSGVSQPVLLATGLKVQTNSVLLAGQSRSLWVSRDGGLMFSPKHDVLPGAVAELIELPGGKVLAVGEAGAAVIEVPQ